MPHAPHELWPFAHGAAIFDFDGTLAHTAHLWRKVDVAFLEGRGLPIPPDYPQRLAALGFADGAVYTKELFGLAETPEQICDEWNAMGRALYQDEVALRPGAERYLRALRRAHVPCALATTNDEDVLRSMRGVDVGALFDACVFARDVGCGKDKPDIYLRAAQELGVSPAECLVFEDIPIAVRSAKRAGTRTCGVRADDPTQDEQAVRRAADLWLDDWQDIALIP